MPAQIFTDDIEFMQQRLEFMTASLILMYQSLHEIVKSEMSAGGAIAMKAIAESTLCEVHKISVDHFQQKPLLKFEPIRRNRYESENVY